VQSAAPLHQVAAGLDVATDGGTLQTVARQNEQLFNGELSHTSPKSNNNSGVATWSFKWVAPSSPGTYTLWGAGNSVNGTGSIDGDAAAATTYAIVVGTPSTATPAATATPSPEDTATTTPTPPPPTATRTRTRTPTRTPTRTSTVTPTEITTEGPTNTPAPTELASETPTETPTEVPTETPVDTPTETPTVVATPGDANCDGTVTAADLPGLVMQIVDHIPATCGGADANGDSVIDEGDVLPTIDAIFGP
jgi:hypothetical protein